MGLPMTNTSVSTAMTSAPSVLAAQPLWAVERVKLPGGDVAISAKGRRGPWQMVDADARDGRRIAAEAYVADRYQQVHGARIEHYQPHLFVAQTPDNPLAGVVGFSCFDDHIGLVEQYLDAPAQEVVSRWVGHDVARSSIMEVGNLAADNLTVVIKLTAFMFHRFHEAGKQWALFTGTDGVRLALRRARIPFVSIQKADPRKLGAEREAWGNYYDSAPEVLLVNLAEGVAVVHERFDIENIDR